VIAGHPALAVVTVSAVLIVLFYASAQLWLRYVIVYRLGQNALSISFIGVPIVVLDYGSVESVRVVRRQEMWKEPGLFFTALKAGNRPLAGRAVIVKRKNGLLKDVILTPADPDSFAHDVMGRSARSGHV